MASNLCRCTGYSSILDAVRAVARGEEAAADASGNGRVRADVAVENGGS